MSSSSSSSSSLSVKRKRDDDVMAMLSSKIPDDLLECVACKDRLSMDSIQASCTHRACRSCWDKCFGKCPVCRKFDRTPRQDPLTIALLQMYPAEAACGATVCGEDVKGHEIACLPCWKKKFEDMEKEVATLNASYKASQSWATSLEERIEVFERQARMRQVNLENARRRRRGQGLDLSPISLPSDDDDETVDEEDEDEQEAQAQDV